jgi:hypothetical protein
VSLEFMGARQDLPPLGVIPAAHAGDLFFGWVNLDSIAMLAEHPAVVRVESLRSWMPTSSSGDGGPGDINGGNSLNLKATGRGVRLAVIDLGFDFLHPALVRQVGTGEQVRALWLHDMQLPPPSSAPAGTLGLRLSTKELQTALDWYKGPAGGLPGPTAVETHLKRLATIVANPDYRTLVQQHGTAVVGIAAGNGRGAPNGAPSPEPGVAPDADLVLIAIGAHDETRFADSSQVCAAFQVAFEDPSTPCVALMADSDNLGPHDGSLAGERFLDELLLQPGRAIVLTAGNHNHEASSSPGAAAWHAVAEPGPGGGIPLPLTLRYDSGAASPDSAEIWFRAPAGVTATASISVKVHDNSVGPPVIVEESATPVTIFRPTDNPGDMTTVSAQLQFDDEAAAYCLQLVFRPAQNKEIVPSEWTIDVTADGPVHAWLDRNNESNPAIARWIGAPALAGADLMTLGSPASATRPLAVGSAVGEAANPSSFSGRGPVRTGSNGYRKPDVVALGEGVKAPLGVPHDRRLHIDNSIVDSRYKICDPGGTSYAAPQVAGACALLFQHFGPVATWADIRQAILQSAVRTSGMPAPDPDGWDSACGFGLLDIKSLFSPQTPVAADLWLPKARGDTGSEPFVAETFWDSSALMLEDAAGRALDPVGVAVGELTPARLRVRVANRGARSARDVVMTAWWAPLGATHPLPRPEVGGGAWQATGLRSEGREGNLQRVAEIAPGEFSERCFDWVPPRDQEGRHLPHLLLATASSEDDPYDPTDTLCAQNNAAMLAIAAVHAGMSAEFQILGSDDTDGLILSCENPSAHLRVEGIPVTALPWRDAAMFLASGRRDRPLYGSVDATADMAVRLSTRLEGPEAVAEITDVLGAERLELRDGRVTIDAGSRLTLPRLRIADGTALVVHIAAPGDATGAIHMLHLSGGRRVGGATVRVLA